MVQEEQASASVHAGSAAPEKQEQLKTYGPFKHASAEENRLHAMTGEELDAEIARSLKEYREMELKLFPKPAVSPYLIPRHVRFFAPQGWRVAVLAGTFGWCSMRNHSTSV